MKTMHILSLLLLWLPTHLEAQRYLPAKVMLTDGRTLEGTVLYKDWGDTPQRIDFKDSQGKTQRLGIADIVAFEVTRSDKGKEFFLRKVAYIDFSPHKLDKLDEHSVPQFVLDTMLVQVLVDSELSLYRYQDEAGKLHYLIEKDSIVELVFKQFYVPVAQDRQIAQNNTFRRQMSQIAASECPGRAFDFSRLRFSEKELIKAVSKLNDCRSAKTEYIYRPEKRPIEYTLLLGASTTSNRFVTVTEFVSPLLGMELEPSLCVMAGVGVNIYLSRANKRLSFSNELVFQANKAKGRAVNKSNSMERYEVRIDDKSLQVNTFLRANFYAGHHLKLFLDGGIVNAFQLSGDSRLVTERDFITFVDIRDQPLYSSYRKHEIGVMFGGGFAWQRLSLVARFETGRAFSPDFETQLRAKTLSVVAGYTF